jgi:hypothetical protein
MPLGNSWGSCTAGCKAVASFEDCTLCRGVKEVVRRHFVRIGLLLNDFLPPPPKPVVVREVRVVQVVVERRRRGGDDGEFYTDDTGYEHGDIIPY